MDVRYPQFSAEDFAGALRSLLPRGRVWPRDPGSTQAKVLSGLAPAFARNSGRAIDLLIDAFPSTTYELLGEWEQSLGLPNTCSGQAGSIEGRQQQVVAKLIETGGQSINYYKTIAAALGFDIEIREFGPFTFRSRFNEPLTSEIWRHVWEITAIGATVVHQFTFSSPFSDPLATWEGGALECVFTRIKPAHTVLIFKYE